MCCHGYPHSLHLVKDELAEVLILLFDEKNRLASFLERILSTEVLHFN